MISDLDFTYEVVFVFLFDQPFKMAQPPPLLPPLVFYESGLSTRLKKMFEKKTRIFFAYMFVSKIEVADHESEVKKFLTPILSFAGI